MREYVVGLNKGVDYEAFWNEMEASTGNGSVPDRAVDIINERPLSRRQCHYELSDSEAETLRQDPRVMFVEIPVEQRDDIELVPLSRQTGNYSKITGAPTNQNNSGINWGLFRCNSRSNNTTDNFSSANYDYPLDGTGVDVVIQDTGCQVDHPEFQDIQGVSRIQQINWYTEAGISGTMPANFYTDTNGHGTHVTGIVAGKTYGRAKNARIYIMHVNLGSDTTGINTRDSFDLITGWHNNKPVDPVTGYKRPTVVNMSWATLFRIPVGVTGSIRFQGNSYNYPGTGLSLLGFSPRAQSSRILPSRDGQIDVCVDECIDAGIIMVGAAGNDGQAAFYASSNVNDYYNSYLSNSSSVYYYMRGSSPTAADGVISVGNVDTTNNPQLKNYSSSCGPRVDVWAPGTNIVSACSNTYSQDIAPYVANYPQNTDFKIANITGTSMASPQVAGLAAQLLQVYPGATPEQIRTKIKNDATAGQLYQGGNSNWGDAYSLCGAPNNYAYQPLNSSQTYALSGAAVSVVGYTTNT